MSFLSNLIEKVQTGKSIEYTLARLGEPGPVVTPDSQYLRIWLRSARIVDVRRWATKFYASVHARFVLTDPLQGQREVVCVIAPDKSFAEMDPAHLDRMITVNRLLLGPVPYRGQVSTDVGLFSVAAVDLAKPYLDLLTSLTETAGISFLSKTSPWAGPIRAGAEMLFSASGSTQLEIGVSRTDANLATGYWLIARVQRGTLPEGLKLDPDDFGLRDSRGRPVSGFPYLVLQVEALDQRDDYASIPDVRTGWDAVRAAVTEGRPDDEVQQRFGQLKRMIAVSPDLVPTDRRRVIDKLARELTEAGFGFAGLPPPAASVSTGVSGAPGPSSGGGGVAGSPPSALEVSAAAAAMAPVLLIPPTRRGLNSLHALLAPESTPEPVGVHDCSPNDEDSNGLHAEGGPEVSDDAAPAASPAMGAAASPATSAWRVARGLLTLRKQIDALAPQRDRSSDGTIGDAAHQGRESDHNAWIEYHGERVVSAMDITHDPAGGCDARVLAQALLASRDPRIKYVIFDRRIFSATVSPWRWREYTGSSPHSHHLHLSVSADPALFDSETPWDVTVAPDAAPMQSVSAPSAMESLLTAASPATAAEKSGNPVEGAMSQWVCGTIDVPGGERPAGSPTSLLPMGVAAKNKLWDRGTVLKVRFMQGSQALQDRVMRAASAWFTNNVNLKLSVAQPGEAAHIRIAFDPDRGSWSYIGRDALSIHPSQPTMNLGWATLEAGDRDFSSVVVHEFGHALGLLHEHNHPLAGVQWNRPAVYADLGGPPNNWDRETIDRNVFAKFAAATVITTPFDKASVMIYTVPSTWTVGGVSFMPSWKPSDGDLATVAKLYPKG